MKHRTTFNTLDIMLITSCLIIYLFRIYIINFNFDLYLKNTYMFTNVTFSRKHYFHIYYLLISDYRISSDLFHRKYYSQR